MPLKTVHATPGKWLRAEPVAAMYAQGKVKHVDPPLAALEDRMCDFGANRLSSGRSPDRLDALVRAAAELTRPRGAAHPEPRVVMGGARQEGAARMESAARGGRDR